jgi:hypothetical protein
MALNAVRQTPVLDVNVNVNYDSDCECFFQKPFAPDFSGSIQNSKSDPNKTNPIRIETDPIARSKQTRYFCIKQIEIKMYDGLIGNKNAEKWTEENVITLMTELFERAKQNHCYTLFDAVEPDLTIFQYEHFCQRFANNETVTQSLKRLKEQVKRNIISDAMQGKVKETMSIFVLKCNHDMQDKQQIEVEHKGSISVNFNLQDQDTDLTDPT